MNVGLQIWHRQHYSRCGIRLSISMELHWKICTSPWLYCVSHNRWIQILDIPSYSEKQSKCHWALVEVWRVALTNTAKMNQYQTKHPLNHTLSLDNDVGTTKEDVRRENNCREYTTSMLTKITSLTVLLVLTWFASASAEARCPPPVSLDKKK